MEKHNYLNNRELVEEIHLSKLSYCEFADVKYHRQDLVLETEEQLQQLLEPQNPDLVITENVQGTITQPTNQSSGQKLTVSADNVNWPHSITRVRLSNQNNPEQNALYHAKYRKSESQWVLECTLRDQAKINRARRLAGESFRQAVAQYRGAAALKPRPAAYIVDPSTIPDNEIVYRLHTYDHIPRDAKRKKNPRKTSEEHVRLNFIPFKHYIIEDGKFVEVGRSHSLNGEFSDTHGVMTDRLATMFLLLTHRYSQRSNWRGYSYVDEMVGQSILQLSQMGLQFNEARSDNPFSYYTRFLENAFTKVLNSEKKNQKVRDELLISRGQTPSFGRQLEHEENQRQIREGHDSDD